MAARNIEYLLFTDGSFDPPSKIGVGGYLLLACSRLDLPKFDSSENVVTKSFSDTNCTRLELEALIWGMEELLSLMATSSSHHTIHVYSDCKTAVDLLGRRGRLEASAFISKRSKQPLNNADLYQKFFRVFDRLRPQLVWVKGHTSSNSKVASDVIQKVFARVDQATRAELRRIRSCPRSS